MSDHDDGREQPETEPKRPRSPGSRKPVAPKAPARTEAVPAERSEELSPEPILDDPDPDSERPPPREPRRRSPEPWQTESEPEPARDRSSRLYRFGRKLLDRGDDVKELASTLLDTGDRAKSEAVRMLAREVRNYLDELKLKEDLVELLHNHSLEMKVSIHLKPLEQSKKSD